MQRENSWFCRALVQGGCKLCTQARSNPLASPGSCLALNLSIGAAREINCSTTQCFRNSHLACHCFSNQSLCSLMTFIKTCWLSFQWHCTIQCFWQDFFLTEKSLCFWWIWHDLLQENKKSTLCFRNRIFLKKSPLLTTYKAACTQSSQRDLEQVIYLLYTSQCKRMLTFPPLNYTERSLVNILEGNMFNIMC